MRFNRNISDCPVRRQCQLLGLAAASYYYRSQARARRRICNTCTGWTRITRHPFYGVRKMTFLLQQQGPGGGTQARAAFAAEALLGLMGGLSQAAFESSNPLAHKRFPYLLKGVAIVRPNQVWEHRHHLYPAAGAGLFTWRRSWTGTAATCWPGSCRSVWKPTSVSRCWRRASPASAPEIFQHRPGGAIHQCAVQAPLLAAQVRLSMDGRGRAFDNIFVERLWRSVAYEEVYLKDYRNVAESPRQFGTLFPVLQRRTNPPNRWIIARRKTCISNTA